MVLTRYVICIKLLLTPLLRLRITAVGLFDGTLRTVPELVTVWFSGSALVSINEVPLRRARLVVTVHGRVNQVTQANSALAGRKMSAGQSAVMLCGWEVKAGMVHSTCG